MAIACFLIGLAILAAAIVFAVRNRYNTRKWIALVLVGIFFSSFFMVLPTAWLKEGQDVSAPLLFRLTSALFYSFKSIGGKPELLQLESMPLPNWMKTVYVVVNYTAFFVAPFLTSGLLLSFFGDMGEKMKFVLRFSEKCRVFSELNRNSLALAKSARKGIFQETVVFCNAKDADKQLVEEARSIGAVVLYKHVSRMKESWRFRSYEYELMAENEEENLKSAELLIRNALEQKKASEKPVVVNAFTREKAGIDLLESLAPKEGAFQIRFIDEIELFCSQLLYQNPLFLLPEGRKDISVMLVGCGEMGMQLLKTALRSGQIDGYTLKIRVYDRDAGRIEQVFYRQCPEIRKLGADLQFIQADVRTEAFLESAKESFDATFVAVTTDSDEQNLSTALDLFRFFRRNNRFAETPPIFARIRKEETAEVYLEQNSEFLEDRNVHLFGTTTGLFSERTLFDTELERLSLAVHLTYSFGKVPERREEGEEKYQKAVRAFYNSSYNRRSSMATALGFRSKLIMCGIEASGREAFPEEALSAYEEKVLDPETLERLTKNEHDRWNYYMATEGFQSATLEEMRTYYPVTGSHKDERLSKIHPCIVPAEELAGLSEAYRELSGQEIDFVEYDRIITEKMTEMVRNAKERK